MPIITILVSWEGVKETGATKSNFLKRIRYGFTGFDTGFSIKNKRKKELISPDLNECIKSI